MPSEIFDLAVEPRTLIAALLISAAALFVWAVAGAAIEKSRLHLRRRLWGKRHHSHQIRGQFGEIYTAYERPKAAPVVARPTDAADQLRIVMGASFSAQRLLNRSETRVFHELEEMVRACNPHWLVMAQVSLGEILRSKDPEAYSCINSKRVDLLLVDENCHPRLVIEYQGAGHHQGGAAARDAVKKEALRRAGIGYQEVIAGQTTPSELKLLVHRLIKGPAMIQPAVSNSYIR